MKHFFFFLIGLFGLSLGYSQNQTVGLFLNDSASYNGYTLIAPNQYDRTYLIDNCGYIVNEWDSDYNPGSVAYLLPETGNLLRTCRVGGSFSGGGIGGRIELWDWDNNLLWELDYANTEHHHHHDVEYMPNGNILLIAWEAKTTAEAIDMGRNPGSVGSSLWPDKIVEIEPTGTSGGNVVWEWHVWDHMVQDYDSTKANYGVIADHPELIDINYGGTGLGPGGGSDWNHLNAVSYNPTLDQIALSSRHFSEIWIIDHSTTTAEAASHSGGNSGKGGDLLYRWGNPRVYDRGTAADQTLYGQHDIQWVPDGDVHAGKLLVYNNGQNRPGGNYSSVDVFTAPMDSAGNYVIGATDAFGPTALDWTYFTDDSFYSPNISGANRLPNGNTLICEGAGGHIFEVDLAGTLVWDYQSPVRSGGPITQGANANNTAVFRAYRIGTDAPGLVGRDLTPTVPIELNPIAYDCTIFGEDTTGSTTVDPAIGVAEDVRILRNPIHTSLLIQVDQRPYEAFIYDMKGQLIENQLLNAGRTAIDVRAWPKGIYIVRLYSLDKQAFYSQKIIRE